MFPLIKHLPPFIITFHPSNHTNNPSLKALPSYPFATSFDDYPFPLSLPTLSIVMSLNCF